MPERVTLPQKKAPMSGAEGHRDVRRQLPVKGEFAQRGMAAALFGGGIPHGLLRLSASVLSVPVDDQHRHEGCHAQSGGPHVRAARSILTRALSLTEKASFASPPISSCACGN